MADLAESCADLARSLIGVEFLEPEHDNAVRALLTCDCGTSTDLTVQIDGKLSGTAEAAFACDGCHTVRWFTIRPVSEAS